MNVGARPDGACGDPDGFAVLEDFFAPGDGGEGDLVAEGNGAGGMFL